jgi:hypothetical protein
MEQGLHDQGQAQGEYLVPAGRLYLIGAPT